MIDSVGDQAPRNAASGRQRPERGGATVSAAPPPLEAGARKKKNEAAGRVVIRTGGHGAEGTKRLCPAVGRRSRRGSRKRPVSSSSARAAARSALQKTARIRAWGAELRTHEANRPRGALLIGRFRRAQRSARAPPGRHSEQSAAHGSRREDLRRGRRGQQQSAGRSREIHGACE